MHTDVYVPSTVSQRFGAETKAHCRYRVSGWPGIISKIYIQTVQKFQAYLEEIFYSIQNVLTTTGTSPDRVKVRTALQSIFNLCSSQTATVGWRVADANK